MKRDRKPTGNYLDFATHGEIVKAFLPNRLPPEVPINFDSPLQKKFVDASYALGRLSVSTTLLPDPQVFLYSYVRREALLSSQIEGTQSSLSDLLLFELPEVPGTPIDDVIEVSNYVSALEHGLAKLKELPISSRLIREVHEKILAGSRGANKNPGEFRTSQNWIGGSRPGNAHFVPPPAQALTECMSELERYVNNKQSPYPPLIDAALVHYQFETIHPFLDGNGRTGRILIVLMLYAAGLLPEPLLYLSLYFKQNRTQYYNLLDSVRTEGNWEAWIDFFLEGVKTTAEAAVNTAQRLLAVLQEDEKLIQKNPSRASASSLQILRAMSEKPITNLKAISRATGLSFQTASDRMNDLKRLGLVNEITHGKRHRVFAYHRYLDILSEDTEPLR